MTQSSHSNYLLNQQYKDGSRLSARGYLSARFRTNPYGGFRWLFDHFRLPAESRMLELGCGLGWLWRQNLDRISAGWDITLSDFSQGMLDETKQNLHASSHPFQFAIVDAQEIPYADGEFDAVIANHMLYHVPDRPKALAEIRRVLKPEGRLYASTLGKDHLREMGVFRVDGKFEMGSRLPFNLENGEPQLRSFFSEVRIYRREDALIVTEAEPIVAYFLSLPSYRYAVEKDRSFEEQLRQRVETYMAEHTSIRLSSDTGLFEAWSA
jgi:ubiquinone/menaquinone biosynthesis C-methylase UbiE